MPRKDLRNLFGLCTEKDHIKYIVKGAEYFEMRGYDFSEEISALFAKACVRCNKPLDAVAHYSTPSYRLGAWSTPGSLALLVAAASKEENGVQKCADMLALLSRKGVRIDKDVLAPVVEGAKQSNDEASMTKLKEVIAKHLSPEDAATLA